MSTRDVQLLPRVDQTDLIHLDTFLLLQCLLHSQNLVLRFKVEGLLAPCQCLDEDLRTNRRATTNGQQSETYNHCGQIPRGQSEQNIIDTATAT